jgi:hypothetical protein
MSETEFDINPEAPIEEAPAVETPDAPAVEPVSDSKVHPAYDGLLAEIPEAWHNKVIPHLQEQDRNFQQQLEKFTPFKEFIDNGLQPDIIRDSLRLADVALNDPVYLYRTLAENLRQQGLLEEANAVEEQADAIEESGDENYELNPAIKKEFDARDQVIAKQQEYLDNIQFEAEVAKEQEVLGRQLEDLNSKYDISPELQNRILGLMEIQLERGEDATIYTAARELAEITGIRYNEKGQLPSQPAPTVIGANGGNSIQTTPLTIPKDFNDKKAMLVQMFEEQSKAQRNSI